MTDPLSLPPAMAARARAFTGPPAPVRPAATVALLRPGDPGPQVYLLRRAATMVFGGVYAFPGGRVDASDRPDTVRTDWARRLGVPAEQARAVVGAAVRELFEETGVLLAGPAGDPARVVGDVAGPAWEAARAAVAARERTLTDLLAEHGLRLRDDLLLPWSRWVTPEFEPRRFDTWFFVALLPAAQAPRDVSGEADATTWVDPAAADGLTLLPPTRRVLAELAGHASLDAVVAAAAGRDAATPVLPRVEVRPDGAVAVLLP